MKCYLISAPTNKAAAVAAGSFNNTPFSNNVNSINIFNSLLSIPLMQSKVPCKSCHHHLELDLHYQVQSE